MSNIITIDGEKSQKPPVGRSGNHTYKKRNIVSAIWPPERVALLKELHPVKTHREIAEILGTTRGSVDSMVTRLKLRKPKPVKRVFEGNRCRNGMCDEKIKSHSWPYCEACMKKKRGQ